MTESIEKHYTTGLIAVLKDVTKPILTRVNAFRKLNDIYVVIDELNLKKISLTDEQLDERLNDIFNKSPVFHHEFDSEEKNLFDALEKNPNIPMDGLKGGRRRRSIGKRSMKRSIKRSMKRSIKRRRSIGKRSVMKRSMKRRRSIGKRSMRKRSVT
jgi:hypothetical protein